MIATLSVHQTAILSLLLLSVPGHWQEQPEERNIYTLSNPDAHTQTRNLNMECTRDESVGMTETDDGDENNNNNCVGGGMEKMEETRIWLRQANEINRNIFFWFYIDKILP